MTRQNELRRMGAADAASILLANWVDSAQSFVQVFTLVYFLLIFGYILKVLDPDALLDLDEPIQRFLYDVVEPLSADLPAVHPAAGPARHLADRGDLRALISGLVIRLLGQLD